MRQRRQQGKLRHMTLKERRARDARNRRRGRTRAYLEAKAWHTQQMRKRPRRDRSYSVPALGGQVSLVLEMMDRIRGRKHAA